MDIASACDGDPFDAIARGQRVNAHVGWEARPIDGGQKAAAILGAEVSVEIRVAGPLLDELDRGRVLGVTQQRATQAAGLGPRGSDQRGKLATDVASCDDAHIDDDGG